uniref:ATP synthase F0 subunit 8 n=1 Tax=Anaedus unidentatus TaxID=2984367 RepID=A0A978D4Y4_9CUCU|nr:ATP synthase F0 subunit 8 [Anaedus unidentatus]UYB79072.1 ATP synthase F0 subunit 8 [Anaedus unidentatus]
MSPLSWLTLMLYFIMIMIILNITNYFFFLLNPSLKKNNKLTSKINWKW